MHSWDSLGLDQMIGKLWSGIFEATGKHLFISGVPTPLAWKHSHKNPLQL
jgi:hypothetical protein